MNNIQLKVEGKIYSGWKEMRVERGIDRFSGAFALSVTERLSGQSQQWPISEGTSCQMLLDDNIVITGYVDKVERSIDSDTHTIKITGRDKAADIVDCAASTKENSIEFGRIKGQTLAKLCKILCMPYGIDIIDETGLTDIVEFGGVDPGQTVFEALEEAARMSAVLIMSNGRGDLVLTRAGQAQNPNVLVEGKNILSASLVSDNSLRFSHYIVLSQIPGADNYDGEFAAHQSAVINDNTITRYRPIVLDAVQPGAGKTVKDFAQWERNVRRGRSRRVTVAVQGWSVNGHHWLPNEMVSVKLPTLGIEGQLLIVSVSHILGDQGSRTEMVLSPREAFDLLPEAADQDSGMVVGVSSETMKLLQ